jgi:hypothetical protein
MFCCIPFGLAALLMFRFVRIVLSPVVNLNTSGRDEPVPRVGAGLHRTP